jgi:hypothetical protein
MEGINSSMIYLIYCKNFCKCHNVPPLSTTIKKIIFLPTEYKGPFFLAILANVSYCYHCVLNGSHSSRSEVES